MKFLLIGSGKEPIPPTGWGAIGKLIWEQKQVLEAAGHQVDVLNQRPRRLLPQMLRMRLWRYDFIHSHEEKQVPNLLKISKLKRLATGISSQYGYGCWPDKWSKVFREKDLPCLLRAPHVLTVSPNYAAMLRDHGFKGQTHHFPNAIHTEDMNFVSKATRQAIVLGKVQPRKKQEFLCEVLRGKPVQLDLYGPLGEGVSPDFKGNGSNVIWQGSWTREQVNSGLTDYACSVLLSDGEAHPVAVLESLAAGCSVVVSEEASHNLDRTHPFIHVVNRDDPEAVAAAISEAVAQNPIHRPAIRQYCAETFDWKVRLPKYLETVQTIRDSTFS